YYHNEGNQTINNLRLRFNPASQGASTSHSITGSIMGDGVSSVNDNATVTLQESETLTFIPGSVRWFPNQTAQSNPAGQTLSSAQENALVGGNGFNIGSLTAGWSSQGHIVAHYRVGTVNDCNPNNNNN